MKTDREFSASDRFVSTMWVKVTEIQVRFHAYEIGN